MDILDLIVKMTITTTGLCIAVIVIYMLFFFIINPEKPLRELTYFVSVILSFALLIAVVTAVPLVYVYSNNTRVQVTEN